MRYSIDARSASTRARSASHLAASRPPASNRGTETLTPKTLPVSRPDASSARFMPPNSVRRRKPCAASRVGFERCAFARLLKGPQFRASRCRLRDQRLCGRRRPAADPRRLQSSVRVMSRGSMPDSSRSRLGDRHRCRDDELARVAELLFSAQAIESRAFAFTLSRAENLYEAFHARALVPEPTRDAPARRRVGQRRPQPPIAVATVVRRARPPRQPWPRLPPATALPRAPKIGSDCSA